MSKDADPANTQKPISKEEFDKRDQALSEALDRLEKEAPPPKPKPDTIGGMF